jgi:hypothetical protein
MTMRLSLAALAAACVAGCAGGPAVDAQWSDPQISGTTPLRSGRVFVVCEAAEAVLARLCSDRTAAELQGRGLAVAVAPDSLAAPPGAPRDDARYVDAARAAGAATVWVSTVAPQAPGEERGSGLSIGLGGFRVGGSGGVGVGVSLPLPAGAPAVVYAANARVTQVASGRLLWTARAGGGSGGEPQQQLDALLPRLVDAAARLF